MNRDDFLAFVRGWSTMTIEQQRTAWESLSVEQKRAVWQASREMPLRWQYWRFQELYDAGVYQPPFLHMVILGFLFTLIPALVIGVILRLLGVL